MTAAVITAAEFAAVMDRLGPFEPSPRVAVAISGGADSMAAGLLVDHWARMRGGAALALIVDHGIRPGSAAEAGLVASRLLNLGIETDLLRLHGLGRGPALAERARDARHQILETACAARGILHLVFGHHAQDQAETVVMRMLARSKAAGLSAMAALVEAEQVSKLRPLLGMPAQRLRATLLARGVAWVEDPSNTDRNFLRPRLRARQAQAPMAIRALAAAAQLRGQARARVDIIWQAELARCAEIFPQGYALIPDGPIAALALAHLIMAIGGAIRPPVDPQIKALAARPCAATLGGVRLVRAGRLGSGWLLLREEAAMQAAIPAGPGVLWDGRYRLCHLPDAASGRSDLTIGAWGRDATRDRHGLPSLVLRTLPVLRAGADLLATGEELFRGPRPHIVRAPSRPAATAPFFPLPAV